MPTNSHEVGKIELCQLGMKKANGLDCVGVLCELDLSMFDANDHVHPHMLHRGHMKHVVK